MSAKDRMNKISEKAVSIQDQIEDFDEKLDVSLEIPLKKSDKKLIKEAAKKRGLSMAAFARWSIRKELGLIR